MNKRMKDPKGDLRFVHKSAQPSGFRVLKLTAMAERAGMVRIVADSIELKSAIISMLGTSSAKSACHKKICNYP